MLWGRCVLKGACTTLLTGRHVTAWGPGCVPGYAPILPPAPPGPAGQWPQLGRPGNSAARGEETGRNMTQTLGAAQWLTASSPCVSGVVVEELACDGDLGLLSGLLGWGSSWGPHF